MVSCFFVKKSSINECYFIDTKVHFCAKNDVSLTAAVHKLSI